MNQLKTAGFSAKYGNGLLAVKSGFQRLHKIAKISFQHPEFR